MSTQTKKQWKEIVLEDEKLPRKVSRGFQFGPDPYVHAFVVSKFDGNYVVKGFRQEVNNYLATKTHWMAQKVSYFSKFGRTWHISRWVFWNSNWAVFEPSKSTGGKFIIIPKKNKYAWLDDESDVKTYRFKRLPNRWIPLYDKLNKKHTSDESN